MSKDLNKWTGIGRLGQDPEAATTKNGNQVAKISLACGDDYKDKNTGKKVERTEWIRIIAFGRLAEIIGQYLSKGSKIYIEGKYRTRKWQNQQGVDQYTTEIVASEMQMLDSRDTDSSSASQAPRQQAPAQSQASAPQGPAAPTGAGMDSFEDDIPF